MRIERLVVVAALLAGCAIVEPSGPDSSAASQATSPSSGQLSSIRPSAARSTPLRPGYALYRAEAVGLVEVIDDGRATYLAFGEPPPASLALFDQDGRPLARVTAGRVTAVDGLFGGILVRDGERAGFAAPDTTAATPGVAWPPGPDHAQARALLDRNGPMMQAMQRALTAVQRGPAPEARGGIIDGAGERPSRSSMGESPGASAAAAPPSFPVSPSIAGAASTGAYASAVAAVSMPAPSMVAAPLAIANAASSRGDLGLVRVFFASASRTIVAPEDGLSLLLRNARLADEIRITGYTDAAGPAAVNELLARARADAILQILLRHGIAPERILVRSVAAAGFIADNGSDRGRALNRRAEIELRRGGGPLALR
jgi:hypothetical protein